MTSPVVEIALSILTIAVYAPVRHFQFVNWDDPIYVTDNRNILEGITLHSLRWAFTTAHSPYWHPITWVSHLLDVQLFGLAPGPHHVTNLVLHTANVLLVFRLLRSMTGAPGPSAFVAAVFAVHPLHVESVAWVTERKDVLSTLFLLLTTAAYVAYTRTPSASRYVLVLGLYGFALMSKPMAVTLPVLLLLLDRWPLGRLPQTDSRRPNTSRVVLEKLPLLVMALSVAVPTVIIQRQVGALPSASALPLEVRLENMLAGYAWYLAKTVLPTRLAAFYPMQFIPWPAAVLDFFILFAITTFAWLRLKTSPFLFVGWGWFVIALSPVSGLFQAGEQAVADRFMYVPILGLLMAFAWAAAAVERDSVKRLITPFSVVTVALLALMASAQVRSWADSVTLWTHALAVGRDSSTAYEHLGSALRDRGDLDAAEAAYLRALAVPISGPTGGHASVQNNLGLLLVRRGDSDGATQRFREAVKEDPGFAQAHNNLGNALAASGHLEDAAAHFNNALSIDPRIAEAHLGLGNIALQNRRAKDAETRYRLAIDLDPSIPEAHEGLASALAMQDADEAAIAEYEIAIALRPGLRTSHFNLAVLLIRHGRTDEGIPHLLRALEIDPAFQPARDLLNSIRKDGRLASEVGNGRLGLRSWTAQACSPDYSRAFVPGSDISAFRTGSTRSAATATWQRVRGREAAFLTAREARCAFSPCGNPARPQVSSVCPIFQERFPS